MHKKDVLLGIKKHCFFFCTHKVDSVYPYWFSVPSPSLFFCNEIPQKERSSKTLCNYLSGDGKGVDLTRSLARNTMQKKRGKRRKRETEEKKKVWEGAKRERERERELLESGWLESSRLQPLPVSVVVAGRPNSYQATRLTSTALKRARERKKEREKRVLLILCLKLCTAAAAAAASSSSATSIDQSSEEIVWLNSSTQ